MFINKQPRVEGLQFVVCARAGQCPRKIMRCGVCPVGFTGRRCSLGCQKFMRDRHLWRKRGGSSIEQRGTCHANDKISTTGQGALDSYPSKWPLLGGNGWAFVPPPLVWSPNVGFLRKAEWLSVDNAAPEWADGCRWSAALTPLLGSEFSL